MKPPNLSHSGLTTLGITYNRHDLDKLRCLIRRDDWVRLDGKFVSVNEALYSLFKEFIDSIPDDILDSDYNIKNRCSDVIS